MEQALGRVESSGGKLLMPKTDIGDPGFMGIIQDSEGNGIGLHAPDQLHHEIMKSLDRDRYLSRDFTDYLEK